MEAERKTYEHRYPSRRSVVYSDRGMVCTSQALAAQTGLDMLKRGGNAVDAAVATAIAMTVLEPTSNGLGSDAFAIVWSEEEKKLFGLNGSGWAPRLLTRDAMRRAGFQTMPARGWASVTVPGAPSAWAELHRRFGRLPFQELFGPAIGYAESGVPTQPVTSYLWAQDEEAFAPYRDEPAFAPFFETFWTAARRNRVNGGVSRATPRPCAGLRKQAVKVTIGAPSPPPSTPFPARRADTSAGKTWNCTGPSGSSRSVYRIMAGTCAKFPRMDMASWP